MVPCRPRLVVAAPVLPVQQRPMMASTGARGNAVRRSQTTRGCLRRVHAGSRRGSSRCLVSQAETHSESVGQIREQMPRLSEGLARRQGALSGRPRWAKAAIRSGQQAAALVGGGVLGQDRAGSSRRRSCARTLVAAIVVAEAALTFAGATPAQIGAPPWFSKPTRVRPASLPQVTDEALSLRPRMQGVEIEDAPAPAVLA